MGFRLPLWDTSQGEKGPENLSVQKLRIGLHEPTIVMHYANLEEAKRSAAVTVLDINIAIVIGPTPPGTGVIKDDFSAQDSNSTSPTNL